jgi:alpha-N-arabinofuranosidase
MTVGEQSARHLDDYRALTLREGGRELPLAVTEYNGPCPGRAAFRLTYGVALECADLLRIFLQPEHNIVEASYWELLNGAFGMLKSDRGGPDVVRVEERPAYVLYHLWAEHLGEQLVTTHVDGPRIPFAGAGSVYPATGDAYVPAHSLGQILTDGRFNPGTLKPGITLEGGTGGAFAVQADGIKDKVFTQLARFPKPQTPEPCDYMLTYDARYVAKGGAEVTPLALGIGDSRGWLATRSGLILGGIGAEWNTFRVQYHALADTTAITLLARREAGATENSGRLEVRNFKIEAFSFPTFPEPSLLTACASLSQDRKTLHLIVFNKSVDRDIPARIDLAGFPAASAGIWEVDGPNLGALTGVAETVHNAPLDLSGGGLHLFPAHTMTAIDFVAQAK